MTKVPMAALHGVAFYCGEAGGPPNGDPAQLREYKLPVDSD
jgi:hypothetical protein